ncbi:MAG: hypothetical protein WC799_25070 [Desulfobacteraceae bacterium]|jgi:hypothetical protein
MAHNKNIVHIHWKGPYTLEQISSYTDSEDEYLSAAGLYQVYGKYLSYNIDGLLYIGMTIREGSKRIPEHNWISGTDYIKQVSDPGNIQIYYGLLHVDKKTDFQLDLIKKCESLLIFSHKPILNIQEKNNMPEADDLIIYNWNDYRNLMPEVSTLRWSNVYWKDEIFKNNYKMLSS